MRKIILLVIAFVGAWMVPAFAQYNTIQVTDLSNKTMRVRQEVYIGDHGVTSAIWPPDGYRFANGPIKVISVIEKSTNFELDYNIVQVKKGDRQAVEIFLPSPIHHSGDIHQRTLTVEVTVEATTDHIQQDSNGFFSFYFYPEGLKSCFILPDGHEIVFSDAPIIFYEHKGRIIVPFNRNNGSKFMLKTRSFASDV